VNVSNFLKHPDRMKKIFVLCCAIVLALTSCDEEEGNPQPSDFYASNGEAAGAIYIHFEKDPNVGSVLVDRREKGSVTWVTITGAGQPFFDTHQYGETGMPPGKVFEYRIRNDWPDDAPYSEIEEGYAYDIIPITEIEIEVSKTANTLSWNAGNHNSHMNDTDIRFDLYRSDRSDSGFEKIAEVGEDRSYFDDFFDRPDMQGKTWYYRVDVRYWPYSATAEGTVAEATGGGSGNPTADYQATDLGAAWIASGDGGVDKLRMKKYNGVIYAGALNNVLATGYGDPSLMQLVGDAWQPVWSATLDNRFNKTHFAVASDRSYVAGLDDSLCVYAWEQAAWSTNLCPDNLGQADSPSQVDIETLSDELYMAITQHPDYHLQVLRRNGDNWETVGGDGSGYITSAQASQVKLEILDDVLYLSYMENDVLHVKHLSGGSWVDDLSWTQSNIIFTQLASTGSKLYLMVGANGTIYRGGIYEVTSGTSVNALITNDLEDWFQFPLALVSDSDGNLVVSSMNIESAEVIHPFLSLYDGTEWKSISGDFSDGIDPVGLQTSGTTIYYLYGDGTNLNALEEPKAVKTMKLSPQ